jgi:hypothetical protein
MPHAFALAWRLLLAVALVLSPIAGLAAGEACAQARALAPAHSAAAPVKAVRVATAMAVAMPGCTHMADMTPAAPKSSQGKAAPSLPLGTSHDGCSAHACCLGGAVAMTGLALRLEALPSRHPRPELRNATIPMPPSGRMLRPPIA